MSNLPTPTQDELQKIKVIAVRIPQAQYEKINELRRQLPHIPSKNQVILDCIDIAYAHNTQKA